MRLARTPGRASAIPRRSTSPLNIAHRGASAELPENTLPALRRGGERGADMVEIDVQRSADGALVVMHDPTLTRTTNVRAVFPHRSPWRVSDFTLEELRRLDAGSWKMQTEDGHGVPTLSEVLDLVAAVGVGLQLELKAPDRYPGVVADLVDALVHAPAAAQVVVQSFNVTSMKELSARMPGIRVAVLGNPAPAHLPVLATWVQQINPHHRVITESYVDEIH